MTCVQPGKSNALIAGLFPAVIFLAMAFIEIELPGLYMDEAYFDAFVVKILDPSKTVDRPLFNMPCNILDKNYRFPLTGAIYHGLIGTYLGAPFYKIFGENFISLRVYHALYGAVIVYLTYLLLSRFVTRRMALWGSLLLAVDVSFLVSFRTQAWNVIHPLPFFLGAMLVLIPRAEKQPPLTRNRAFAAGLLIGFAGYGYFVYWLLTLPLLIAFILFYRNLLTRKAVVAGLLGCFLGCLPLIFALYSLARNAPQVFAQYLGRTGSPLGLSDRLTHLGAKIFATFSGQEAPQYIAGPHHICWSEAKAYLWAAAAVCLIAMFFIRGESQKKKFILLCILCVGLFFAACLKFGEQIAVHHVVILLPFAYLALAAFVELLTSQSTGLDQKPPRRWRMILGGCLFAGFTFFVVPMNLLQYRAMTRELVRTGGVRLYSSAVNSLAEYLLVRRRDDTIIFCDWGYMLPCHFLSRGVLHHEYYYGDTEAEWKEKIPGLFASSERLTFVLPRDTIGVWRSPKDIQKIRSIIMSSAETSQKRLRFSEVFYQRDGTPVVEAISFARDAAK
jgi:dolichyl-phosphate-mannose--protein O-mannosyl transferase